MKKVIYFWIAVFFGITHVFAITSSDQQYDYIVLEDSTVSIQEYLGNSAVVQIPDHIDGKEVSVIDSYAFWKNTTLTSITIPSTVKEIQDAAFADCSNLSTVSLSEGLKVIEKNAFQNNTFTSIHLPSTLESIGDYAFIGVPLTSIEIPQNVKKIGGGLTYDTNITAIQVNSKNENYTSIEGVLYTKDLTHLVNYPAGKQTETYTVREETKVIDPYAFISAKYVKHIFLPTGLETIKESAFAYLPLLEEMTLPETVQYIDAFILYSCDQLKSVTVKGYLDSLATRAIAQNPKLEEIRFEKGFKSNSYFSIDNNAMLKRVIIEGKVESLCYAFIANSKQLEQVIIPDDIFIIEKNFLYNCNEFTYKIPSLLSSYEDGSYRIVHPIHVSGYFDYDFAKRIFEIMNEERAKENVNPLKLDNTLMEQAMLRSEELPVYFDHTRPDGRAALDLKKANGENIIAGYSTPEATMTGWMNSPGHRSNILRDTFQSVGVGCYVMNGTYFCVQLFSYEETEDENVKSGTESHEKDINTSPLYMDYSAGFLTGDPNESIYKANAVEIGGTLKTSGVKFINTEYRYFRFSIPSTIIKWESSDSSIFTVDEDGTLHGKGEGTATLKTSLYGVEKEYPVAVGTFLKQILAEPFALKVGEEKEVAYTLVPQNATINGVTLVSGNESIIKIEGNKVIGVQEGTTRLRIFVDAINDPVKVVSVNVVVSNTPIPVDYIYFKENNITMGLYETRTVIPEIEPVYATDKTLTYESYNPSVVTVTNEGTLKAVGKGQARIRVSTSNGKYNYLTVNVLDYLKGDLTRDGAIQVADATEALLRVTEQTKTIEEDIQIADFDGNKKIDVSDATEILLLYMEQE